MKNLGYLLFFLSLMSCYNDKEFYSLQFERNTVNEVAEKIKAFHTLVEKLPPTRHYTDYSGPFFVEIDSGRRGIILRGEVYLNFKKIGEWDSLRIMTSQQFQINKTYNNDYD